LTSRTQPNETGHGKRTEADSTRKEALPWPGGASDEERLAGALHARIERWLELEGVFTIFGFGDVELAGELDREPGAGPVYLGRLDDGQVWRADSTVTARPAAPPGQPGTRQR
jgi:hypothetical protein